MRAVPMTFAGKRTGTLARAKLASSIPDDAFKNIEVFPAMLARHFNPVNSFHCNCLAENKAAGKVMNGLVRRREAERVLFLKA